MTDAIRTLCVAASVNETSPFAAVLFVTVAAAYGAAEYERILPVVGREELSVTTWMFADKYQLPLMAWSDSAEATSAGRISVCPSGAKCGNLPIVMLCGLPSTTTGMNGVRSTW
jgi:hypothetical protein